MFSNSTSSYTHIVMRRVTAQMSTSFLEEANASVRKAKEGNSGSARTTCNSPAHRRDISGLA